MQNGLLVGFCNVPERQAGAVAEQLHGVVSASR
jgi:hypothetical protein